MGVRAIGGKGGGRTFTARSLAMLTGIPHDNYFVHMAAAGTAVFQTIVLMKQLGAHEVPAKSIALLL